jgi:hypothetical protein
VTTWAGLTVYCHNNFFNCKSYFFLEFWKENIYRLNSNP